MVSAELTERIKHHEGFRGRPYQDTTGHTTIGYGRNLDANPLTRDEASVLLDHDITAASVALAKRFPFTDSMHPTPREALVEMTFNLGIDGLAGFKKMWAALRAGDYERARVEALDSAWAVQIGPARAEDIAERLRGGALPA